VVEPRYWLSDHDLDEVSCYFAYRNITNVTNERTVICAAIPRSGVAHSAPIYSAHRPAYLGATLCSFVLDYVARQKLGGTNLTYGYVYQLPVLAPSTYDVRASWDAALAVSEWLSPRLLELTYTAWDLEAFANDLGYYGPPFRWDEERRPLLRAELDACFFHLYGIERDDVDYILGTFPIVNRKDREKYGEERTRRLILERYDALAEATASGVPYRTVLDPPPADPSVAHPELTRPDWATPPAAARG
jgi:hypothetical protein